MSVEPGGNRPIMGIEGHMGIEVFSKDQKLPEGFKALSPKQRKFLVDIFEKKGKVAEKESDAKFKEISAKVEKWNRYSKGPLGKAYLKVYNFAVKRLWSVPGRKSLQERISSYDQDIANKRDAEVQKAAVRAAIVQEEEKPQTEMKPELADVIYKEVKPLRRELSKEITGLVGYLENQNSSKPKKNLEEVLMGFIGKANEIKGKHEGEEEDLMTVYEPLQHARKLFAGGSDDLNVIFDNALRSVADQHLVNWVKGRE